MKAAATATTKQAPTDHRTRLQGVWLFLTGRREARLIIEGDAFTVVFKSGETYRGTFALDPAKRPAHIDMTVTEGPERHVGKVSLGIYELIGETMLRWCPGRPGTGERPADFPEADDETGLVIVFRRSKERSAAALPKA
jgi:uncharacterized protein (TIGR03067 family)